MKRKTFTKLKLLAFSCAVCILCNAQAQTQNQVKPDPKDGYLIKSYQVDELGYGYEIIDGATNKTIIRQTIIPCVQGIYRFKTDEEAHNIGVLAARLMTKGIFPPTVTFNQLDSLKTDLTFVKPSDLKR